MLILMGPSASGKTEVAKLLESRFHLVKVVTHTTRDMRVGEKNDIDYHFVSKETFLKMKENNEFVETTLYNDQYYGTSKKEVSDEKCVVLDPNGARSFHELHDERIFIVYLSCSEEERIARMHIRHDEEKKIVSRIASDHLSFDNKTPLIANIVIDSEKYLPEPLSKEIYRLYKEYLKSLAK